MIVGLEICVGTNATRWVAEADCLVYFRTSCEDQTG